MVSFKEFMRPVNTVAKLGALKFTQDIFGEQKRTPHYEMNKALEIYETRPMVNSALKQIARFIMGNEVSVKSSDERTYNFLNTWVDQRKHIDGDVFNMIITGLATGNMYLEKTYRERTNGGKVLDNVYNLNDSSRVYRNLPTTNQEENLNEYWLYEVPIEMRGKVYSFGESKTPKFWKVNYVYGSYLFSKMVWAIPVAKEKLDQKIVGWSRDGIYGRSFLASCIDDTEILTEIMRNYAIIAKYRAIGRKIMSIGDPENPASMEDMDKLECDLKNLDVREHIIINKPLKSEPLAYTGENDPMTSEVDFLRKNIGSGLLPNFLTPWSTDVNRATASEAKIPFELEIKSFKSDVIEFLNDTIIGELRKEYSWIAEDATFVLGDVGLDAVQDKMNWASNLYMSNALTLNELRMMAGLDAIEGGDQFKYKIEKETGVEIDSGDITKLSQADTGQHFKEQLKKNHEDEEFFRKAKAKNLIPNKDTTLERRYSVRGQELRLVKNSNGYSIFDGITLMKTFEPDFKEVANEYFEKLKQIRIKELEEFYEGDLPEDKTIQNTTEKVKRMNAEVIDEVFQAIKDNKIHIESFKEQMGLSKNVLPRINDIFSRFNSRIGEVVKNATNKILGIAIAPGDLGPDVEASELVKNDMKSQAEILNERTTQQLKTMNDKMKMDVFRQLSDGIASGRKLSDIKKDLKDKYSQYKTKENPQDYQIERVVRTELTNSTVLMKLKKWKDMGFDKVKQVVHIDERTCNTCKPMNQSVHNIDTLINNEKERIPLHPSCRCTYVAYS